MNHQSCCLQLSLHSRHSYSTQAYRMLTTHTHTHTNSSLQTEKVLLREPLRPMCQRVLIPTQNLIQLTSFHQASRTHSHCKHQCFHCHVSPGLVSTVSLWSHSSHQTHFQCVWHRSFLKEMMYEPEKTIKPLIQILSSSYYKFQRFHFQWCWFLSQWALNPFLPPR